MEAVEVTEYGQSDSLNVVDRAKPTPNEGEVRIDIKAVGINFADIMQRRGNYVGGPTPPYIPGFEAAGTIDAIGPGVDRKEGERVVAQLGQGAYAEYTTAPEPALFDIPESISFEEAAGFPVQFLTAHNCLFERGDLEEGESVLIHAAAGGVGSAAVQLAREANAEIYATASTVSKLNLAERLGADQTINYTEVDFSEEVNALTNGEGVDLVLDAVGGETTTRSLECLSHFGRLVAYGAASGDPGEVETTSLLFNNFSILGYSLGQMIRRDPQRVLQAVPELESGLRNGTLEVIVGHTFPLKDAAEAHEFVEERKSQGKVVLNP
jgi:NADPH2:quinone reductase